MTLHDFLHTHTREVQDTLQACENSIRDLGLQNRAELVQIKALESDVDLKHRAEEEKRVLLQDSEAKIRELNRQIEELHRERDELTEKIQDLSLALTGVEEEIKRYLGQRKKIMTRAEHFERRIKELVAEKERLQRRLCSARRTAFQAYLDDLAARLARHVVAQEERSDKVVARKKLEQARHEDAQVMNLYEARTELQNLLKISNVAAVRDQLQQQLRSTENEIEAMFPGALDIEAHDGGISQIEEIFLQHREDIVRIFLPISIHTWKAIGDGEQDAAVSSALRLVWGIARSLGGKSSNARLKTCEEFVLLEIDANPALTTSIDISMPLPGSETVVFILSKLPHEVQEAIRHEDSNK